MTLDLTKPSADAIAASSLRVPVLILIALGIGLLLTLNGVIAVWQTGVFHDPDDAMRMVQVRALLAGQNWYDMSVYRLDPPDGSFMHWSRIVDIPLALLIKGFELFLPVESAERLCRIVFPMLLQAALYVAVARLAKTLLGREAIASAVVLTLLSGIAFGQFQPGRVDHHAPQIVLLALMLGELVASLRSQRISPAIVSGSLAAVSMAISLENMPFILTLWGLTAALWIWHGHALKPAMRGFAIGLSIGLPICFVATVGPARWLVSVSDALSFGQLLAGLMGASVCLCLGMLPERLSRPSMRFGLAAAGAIGVTGILAFVAPQTLRGPFSDVDPLVRDVWLSNVHEAWSFLRLAQKEPDSAIVFMAPLLLASCASIAACFYETGRRRWQWILVAALSMMGVFMGLCLIRALTSVAPLAPLGGVWAAMVLKQKLARAGWHRAAPFAFALLLPFASIPWALAVGGDGKQPKKDVENCHASAWFAAFASLPPGLVLAPIDAGSHLLALTPHSVLAAPYHRNNHGNRVALDSFLAPTDEARAIVIANGARYVAICSGLGETAVLGARAPRSLAAALVDDRIPDWLQPIPAANTPYKIFKVR
jgi:hypothetical protein